MNISNKEAIVNVVGDKYTAVEIANWCRKQSLIHDVDYKWYMTSLTDIVFEFNELSTAEMVRELWK